MVAWQLFNRKSHAPQKVTAGRFEMERDGKVAYLEYTVSGNVLALLHTEVPLELRQHGLSALLADSAFRWAREHNMKVDVICPSAHHFLAGHPEYRDLVLQ